MGMTTVVVILVVLALVLAVRGVVREGSGGLSRIIEVWWRWRRAARERGRRDEVVRARPHLGATGTKAPLPVGDGKVRCLLIGSELRP